MKKATIAIDAMGGDFGPLVTVPAALKAIKKHKNLHLILVGDQAVLESHVRNAERITIKHASQQVAMDELPSKALRFKKNSSIRVAVNLVKSQEADACISAGNTGALMATARFVLKTLPGIDRPAIIATLPTSIPNKEVRMLDLGANIDCNADNLYQFAIMGSVLSAAVNDISSPKVALLNIGEEEMKGNDLVKHASQLLSQSMHINYCGYIEGDDMFKGEVDLVVCNGFVGNVALKTMEGVAKLLGFYLKKAFSKGIYSRLSMLFALPALRRLKKDLDPGKRNGASLIGLQGIVVKSHGSADIGSFANAIDEAVIEVEKNVPSLIGKEVAEILEEDEL